MLAPSRDHAASPGGWGLVKGMGAGLVGGAAIAVTGTVCGLAFRNSLAVCVVTSGMSLPRHLTRHDWIELETSFCRDLRL